MEASTIGFGNAGAMEVGDTKERGDVLVVLVFVFQVSNSVHVGFAHNKGGADDGVIELGVGDTRLRAEQRQAIAKIAVGSVHNIEGIAEHSVEQGVSGDFLREGFFAAVDADNVAPQGIGVEAWAVEETAKVAEEVGAEGT